ncbi:MAG: S8 family serine peptidase [Actinomycetota bacterium]
MRRLSIILACQVALAGIALPTARAQEPRGRYIVVLKAGTDPAAAASSQGKRYGFTKRKVFKRTLTGYSADIPASRLDDLRADPRVDSVNRVRTFRATAETTPTGVSRVRAPETVNRADGVGVAILDTGIDNNHPDLAGNIAGGVNCIDDGGPSNGDDISSSGHGTHVAGIVGAIAGNGEGLRGVAPGVDLWAVRVLDVSGSGSDETIICGLEFVDARAPANGGSIKVANLSLEAPSSDSPNCGDYPSGPDDTLHMAICKVVNHGVTVVVAAGNSARDFGPAAVPATYDQVITVSALQDKDGAPCGLASPAGSDDVFAGFSNYATSSSDLAHLVGAPGVNINSTWNNGGYKVMDGTSMASPHVAGAAALYISEHPGATPSQVLAGLKAAGEPLNVNFNGECAGSQFSHTSPSGLHTERVVAIPPAVFVVVPPATPASNIGVQFAGPVGGIDATNVVLRLSSGGANIPASVSYDAATQRATVDPSGPILSGELYHIVVSPTGSTPVTDGDGDPIPESAVLFRGPLFEQEWGVWARYYWRSVSNASAHGGKLIMDRTPGAWASFTFTGTGIAWYSMKGPDQGIARVSIDGVDKGTFDNFRSSPQWRVRRSWGVTNGTHTIRILALGKKNASASNSFVNVDAFGVGTTLYANPSVLLSWRSQSTSLASGGRALQDSSSGANVYYRFRGTGIDWRTLVGPDQGMAKVYIDGVYKGMVDNYATATKGYTRAFRGLSNAVHEIRIVVAGTKRSASKNTTVGVDFWRVI